VACHPKSHAEQLKKPRSLSYQPVLHAIGSQLVNCHDGLVLEKLYARVANMHFMRCGEWSGVEGCGVVGLSKIGSTHCKRPSCVDRWYGFRSHGTSTLRVSVNALRSIFPNIWKNTWRPIEQSQPSVIDQLPCRHVGVIYFGTCQRL
jgi:hypothetical protein